MIRTREGAKQYEHSLDHAVEFYSKAGSLFAAKKGKKAPSFYGGEETALGLFQKTWIVDPLTSMKLLFWLRDCRGGAGNRSGFVACLEWLATHDPAWVAANIGLIPAYGRWSDLRALFSTPLIGPAATLWAEAIAGKNVLAAKWAKRHDVALQKVFGINEAELRKMLAAIRSPHIVESKMCAQQWKEIVYSTVPSVAMARYTKAFTEHDPEGMAKFLEKVEKGEAAVHAEVLFPHDCVRTSFTGNPKVAEAQFNALPNLMEGTTEKIIVVCDTSGSMSAPVAAKSTVQRVHVSQALALYCSAKIPESNPFHKKFIAFCSEGRFIDWNGMTFTQALRNDKVFNGAVGSTQVGKALMTILGAAKYFKLTQEQLPTMLLIISDMQFHEGVDGDGSEVENVAVEWQKAGYTFPKVVFWNVAGHAGSPATIKTQRVGLVSGFSTGNLTALLTGTDFSPRAIMQRALEKYQVVDPR